MQRVNGKTCIVTGAALGIGRACALRLAGEGASVALFDMLDEEGHALLAELQAAGHEAGYWHVDVADEAAVRDAINAVAERFGGVHVLVNNAGIAGPTASVEQFDPDAWDAVLRVNLTGTFNVTRACIPHLKRATDGSILVMSSLAGRFGYPNRSAYSTTKWGLVGFTKTLSRELGDFGIRVNAILPGAVEGPRIEQVLAGRAQASGRSVEQERAAALGNQSIKRFVPPQEIAALALFLASSAGRSISGQILPIDGDSQSAS